MSGLRVYAVASIVLLLSSCGQVDAPKNENPPAGLTNSTGQSDTLAPSTPTDLIANAVSSNVIELSWSTSIDNVGVAGYKIYRDGTAIADATTTSYSDTGLTAGTTYVYTVAAYDVAGNISSQSSSVTTTTKSVLIAASISLPKTGQTVIYNSGDDGALQNGVSWPEPRFSAGTDPEFECIMDNLTGLMWAKSPDSTKRTWQQALEYANTLTLCGYADWRLPNLNELESHINAGQASSSAWLNSSGFDNIQQGTYWSSTTRADNTNYAWDVNINFAHVLSSVKTNLDYVWSVRAGQTGSLSNSVISLPVTGQTGCYDGSAACMGTGQDGELQTGVVWPSPRFTAGTGSEAQCITDNLTGLIWAKSPDSTTRTWADAIAFANDFTLCGYSDWRLPNRKELRSLIDYSKFNPALPSGNQFAYVQPNNNYWSSTTRADNTAYAWFVNMFAGTADSYLKTSNYYLWPVRGGQ